MCIILFGRDGRPKPEYIANSANSNSHGIGIAWHEHGILRYKKGLTIPEAQKMAAELPLGYVIHCRIASVGGVTEQLIHPFPVNPHVPLKKSGKANKLLFHNGTWSDWKSTLINHLTQQFVLPEGVWSDTRAIAFLTSIHGKDFLKLITSNGNHAGKFLFMTPAKTSIVGDWTEEDGVFYSNSGYKWGGSYSSRSYERGHYEDGVFVPHENNTNLNESVTRSGSRPPAIQHQPQYLHE